MRVAAIVLTLSTVFSTVAAAAMVAPAPPAEPQDVLVIEPPAETRPVVSADGRMTLPNLNLPTPRQVKCRRAWRALAPWSYSPELCDFFVAEHERVGLGEYWAQSLAYALAAWGARCGVDLLGAYGPMDQRFHNGFASGCRTVCRDLLPSGMAWQPDVLLIPRVNIRCHVEELRYWHDRTGREGWSLYRMVFLPAAPDGRVSRGWASRWPREMARIEAVLH